MADGQRESGCHDDAAGAEAGSPPRPPPSLKPSDSFGSDFYGELKDFSIDSQGNTGNKTAGEAEDANAKQDVYMEDAKTEPDEETEPPVVLSFKRKPLPPPVAANEIPKAIPPSHWSHKLYCGPNGEDVIVEYCYTIEQSEKTAQKFLEEPVLGLDMEWYPYPSDELKKNASVLQLASQSRIAIFHLARHEGTTAAQIVPPSLKRIIESADILKTGVHIIGADCPKLRDWLKLKPKGLFEVSHLYNLLSNRRNAGGYVSRKSKKMSEQVEEKLGLPLLKDSVRTSNWHRPLNQSQIDYAAGDAYAGFMLFHVMNEERKLLKPTPPRPGFAELGQPIIGIPEDKDGDGDDPSDEPKSKAEAKTSKRDAKSPRDELKGSSLLLYDALAAKRTDVAGEKGVKHYQIVTNQVLKQVAVTRPQTIEDLRRIKGLGDQGIRNFATTMIDTIKALPAEQDLPEEDQDIPEDVIIDDPIITEKTRKTKSGRGTTDVTGLDKSLYDALREKRKEIAAERKIAAWELYRIASNGVLTDIAKMRPSTLDQLREIKGISNYFATQFGPSWLSVIRDFESAESVEHTILDHETTEEKASQDEDELSEDEDLYISADTLPPGAESCLAGERVVFTGILDILGRTGAEDLASKCGAEVIKKADSETTIVITGRNVSESKLQIIKEQNLRTMSEEEFITLIRRKADEASSAAQRKSPLASLSTLDGNNLVYAKPVVDIPAEDRPCFNALRAFRTQLSRLSNMPAESICSDGDLLTIAIARPQRRSDLVRMQCARSLDRIACQHGKSVDVFLMRHNERAQSTPTSTEGARREPSNESESDGSDKENVFERREKSASPLSKWKHAEFPAPPPATSGSRKRKF